MAEVPSQSLVLIGTVHRDRAGFDKLLALLEQLQPSEITLELSWQSLDFRRLHSQRLLRQLDRLLDHLAARNGLDPANLKSRPAVADIRELLLPPFEYLAAAAYAQKRHVPLALIDSEAAAADHLRRIEKELVTYRNLKILTRLSPCEERIGEDFSRARSLVFARIPAEVRRQFLDRRRGKEGIGPRDASMAAEIRRRLQSCPAPPLVHIGGWVHLVSDVRGETLFSRLHDLQPKRVLLLEEPVAEATEVP